MTQTLQTKECIVTWKCAPFLTRDYECGHSDSRRFRVKAFDREEVRVSQHEHCPTCFIAYVKKHTIFCGLCGLSIMPLDQVALYSYENEDKNQIPENATYHNKSVIGCLRPNCCPSGGFFAGHWTTKGFKSYRR